MHVTVETMPELRIEAVEVTPIVVPLAQEYRGSYYRNSTTTSSSTTAWIP